MDLRAAAERFLDSPSLSEGTRRAYRGDVGEFCDWLDQHRIALEQVDIRVLSEYIASLGERRTRKLAPATISRKLAAVRAFLRHALGPERVPDGRLAPRRARHLPDAPTSAEIERLLAALEGDGAIAVRNRALVELVYSAGLRSAEVVGLDLGGRGSVGQAARAAGREPSVGHALRPERVAEEGAHRRELPRDRGRRELPRPPLAERGDVVRQHADVDLLERDPVLLEPVAELPDIAAVSAARPRAERGRVEEAIGRGAEVHPRDFRRAPRRAYLAGDSS